MDGPRGRALGVGHWTIRIDGRNGARTSHNDHGRKEEHLDI